MRHFIVLGFATNSKTEPGKALYIGCNRGEAISNVNTPEPKFARKAMYELAVPQIARYSKGKAKNSGSNAEVETEVETEAETPGMTAGAKALAEEHGLTDEQLAEIEPTGKNGKLTKEDVEDYLDPPDPE